MAARIGRRDVLWLALICSAFVLLAVNVLLGMRGFERPNAGIGWRVVEAPGIAMGWGGVALLVVAMPYALVAWIRGKSPGKVVAVFGTLVFAAGVAGIAALSAEVPRHGGGQIGAWLGPMLGEALGTAMSIVILGAIALPGLLLSLAPLLLSTSHLLKPGRVEQAKAWYPKPQVTEEGLEVPMSIPGTDVGPIRYRDDTPPPPPPKPEPVPPAPRSRPIAGVRYADGGDSEGPAVPELAAPGAHLRAKSTPREPSDAALPPGIRYVEPAASDADPAPPVEEEAAFAEAPPPPPPEPPPQDPEPPPVAAAESVESVETATPAARQRKKLAESVVFERGKLESSVATKASKPPAPKPRPAKAKDLREALQSLFTNLPLDELPPARIAAADEGSPADEPAAADDPSQLSLFTPSGGSTSTKARKSATGLAHPACADPLYAQAAEAAIERGSASLVLLKRRLDIGYSRAASLLDALAADGVVGDTTASGSRPTLLSRVEWLARRKR